MITAERLRELLTYDASTGVFTSRTSRANGKIKVGDIAGTMTRRGYRHIRLDNKIYQSHRLVWLHVHGRWPINTIDHINGVHDDNRLSNLREATQTENNQNRKRNKNHSSGFKGVSRMKNKWCAQVGHKYLGLFNSPKAAHAAYCEAALKHYGEFARFE